MKCIRLDKCPVLFKVDTSSTFGAEKKMIALVTCVRFVLKKGKSGWIKGAYVTWFLAEGKGLVHWIVEGIFAGFTGNTHTNNRSSYNLSYLFSFSFFFCGCTACWVSLPNAFQLFLTCNYALHCLLNYRHWIYHRNVKVSVQQTLGGISYVFVIYIYKCPHLPLARRALLFTAWS